MEKRLRKEYDEMIDNPPDGCYLLEGSPFEYEWTCAIEGPEDTPYEEGYFKLVIQFNSDHPIKIINHKKILILIITCFINEFK